MKLPSELRRRKDPRANVCDPEFEAGPGDPRDWEETDMQHKADAEK